MQVGRTSFDEVKTALLTSIHHFVFGPENRDQDGKASGSGGSGDDPRRAESEKLFAKLGTMESTLRKMFIDQGLLPPKATRQYCNELKKEYIKLVTLGTRFTHSASRVLEELDNAEAELRAEEEVTSASAHAAPAANVQKKKSKKKKGQN